MSKKNISATQILREINFGRIWAYKTAILTVLKTLEFEFWEIWALKMAQIYQNQNSERLKIV